MYFYRPLRPFKAMTFDLDDTLYDNQSVIEQTENAALEHLHQNYPELRQWKVEDFRHHRLRLKKREPEIYHDVTRWRWRSLYLILLQVGYDEHHARQGADESMACFAAWRSRISVPEETHETLRQLAVRFPLVAITNGNVDPGLCGLGDYFQAVLRSGPDGRAKPYPDMYRLAAQQLGLPPQAVLHVGDDLNTDVTGSLRSGMQACWINSRKINLMKARKGRLLPHLEISRLASLLALL